MKWLLEIRELIWPLLEKEAPNTKEQVVPTIVVEKDNYEFAFDLVTKIADGEDERRKGIESKASLFLSTITLTSTLVVAANTLVTGKSGTELKSESHLMVKLSVVLTFLLTVYTIRTVWFSVKALQRGTYHTLGFDDINKSGSKDIYTKTLIAILVKNVESNYKTINSKVDSLVMAQEYYKRAIVLICIYAFFILLSCFVTHQ